MINQTVISERRSLQATNPIFESTIAKTWRCSLAALACLSLALSLSTGLYAQQSQIQVSADIIFVGDNIITMDRANDDVEAVAVAGDRIIAVGSESEVRGLQTNQTRVVQLGDKALIPGLIDAHGHFAGVARYADLLDLSSPPVGQMNTISDIVEAIRRRIEIKQIPPGEWINGFGYDDSLLAEKRHPTAADLDQASTEHPIELRHVSGHLMAVNTAALELAGVSALTDNPDGGVIRRISGSNQPDGVLEETAMRLIPPVVTAADSYPQLIRDAINTYAGYGVTTIQDGGVPQSLVDLMTQEAAKEAFPVDIVAYIGVNVLSDQQLEQVSVQTDYTNGFRTGGVKFVLDGSPQGRTAWLSEPYTEGPPGESADYTAYPSYDPDAYKNRMPGLLRRGIPVLAHANGDAAIDLMIDGVDEALTTLAAEGLQNIDHRSVTIHGQLMRADQLDRVQGLGIVPSYYAAHPYFWGDWHRLSFGEQRAAFISPLQATLDRDIPFTIHNDSPVVPPDMMRLLWVATNRETRSGHILGPDQRLSVWDALYSVTQGAAYQYFEEDNKGSITVGKQADLVILDRNPLSMDKTELRDVAILETFAKGETVFSASP